MSKTDSKKDRVEARSDRPRAMRKVSLPSRCTPVVVDEAEDLTPTVRRIVLRPMDAGTGVESRGLVGEYVRIVVPPATQQSVPAPEWRETKNGWWPVWEKPAPPTRKYTIRRYWEESGAIEINVTLHDDGPGTTWACTAQPGMTSYVLGPKSGLQISYDYDYYLMVCDETGLPSVARWLEQLPATAHGRVWVRVPGPKSVQKLSAPVGVEVHWQFSDDDVIEAVTQTPRPAGEAFAWLVGESGLIRPLRTWLRDTWQLEKSDRYSSNYWKDKRPDRP